MRRFSFIFIFLWRLSCFSQTNVAIPDTLKLSLSETEKCFINNNLLLLAQKFSIEAAKAQILQEKLWDNPNFSFEQNIYNQITHKYFDFSASGETAINIDQLFVLAGKRNKRVKLEKINTEMAEYQFYDLLRTLKFQLPTNF